MILDTWSHFIRETDVTYFRVTNYAVNCKHALSYRKGITKKRSISSSQELFIPIYIQYNNNNRKSKEAGVLLSQWSRWPLLALKFMFTLVMLLDDNLVKRAWDSAYHYVYLS